MGNRFKLEDHFESTSLGLEEDHECSVCSLSDSSVGDPKILLHLPEQFAILTSNDLLQI